MDFTYVPTWSGMAFTAFVADACRSVRSSTATFVAARWTGSGTTPEGTMSFFGNDILRIANGRFVQYWTASRRAPDGVRLTIPYRPEPGLAEA